MSYFPLALSLSLFTTSSYRPWFYNQTAASIEVLAEKSIKFGPNLVAQALEKAQFGGEVIDYEQGLKFVTFHGSGHMVRFSSPSATNKSYSRIMDA